MKVKTTEDRHYPEKRDHKQKISVQQRRKTTITDVKQQKMPREWWPQKERVSSFFPQLGMMLPEGPKREGPEEGVVDQ
jgi:predicted metal-dependent hydrolase